MQGLVLLRSYQWLPESAVSAVYPDELHKIKKPDDTRRPPQSCQEQQHAQHVRYHLQTVKKLLVFVVSSEPAKAMNVTDETLSTIGATSYDIARLDMIQTLYILAVLHLGRAKP